MFDRVCLINLKRRPDRLEQFRQRQREKGWPLPEPLVFEAISGDTVGVPDHWRSGGGAWGCCRSHVACLERAAMDGVESVLMLEDDLTWFGDLETRLNEFMSRVPNDWQMLLLGGQHIQQPQPHGDGIVKTTNCQRTHAYAIRGKTIPELLKLWYKSKNHIDWDYGPWQTPRRCYAPDPFLFGQCEGKSDISGNQDRNRFWTAPREPLTILLHAPKAVVKELRERHHWHTGHWRDSETDLDRGLVDAMESTSPVNGIGKWWDSVSWECASEEGWVPCCWHPEIKLSFVERAVRGKVIEITANTVQEAKEQFERATATSSEAPIEPVQPLG